MQKPSEKQKQFFISKYRFIAYGGARGGGKSWAVRKKAMLLCVNYPEIRILLLRKSFPQLRENHILPLLQDLKGVAKYSETQKAFLFPNASRLKLGYLDSEADVLQYQGQEYDVIFMDEATHFTKFQFDTLTACLRGANNFPKRIYLTCNPGGIGHEWVKRLFITRQYKTGENPDDYVFIPARVYDNTALIEKDIGYVGMLEALSENLRRAWLDGDWDAMSGQYFTEFRRDVHVISPFVIPGSWKRYLTLDYGLDMLAAYWIAISPSGEAYVYRELYEKDLIVSCATDRIIELERGERIDVRLAPPDLWGRHADTGKSTAELFSARGIYLVRASSSRVQGWLNLKEWLKIYKDNNNKLTANLKIFENCINLIRTLPSLQHDEHNPNDVSKFPHELTHAPDALRYFIAGRPMPNSVLVAEEEYQDYDSFVDFGR